MFRGSLRAQCTPQWSFGCFIYETLTCCFPSPLYPVGFKDSREKAQDDYFHMPSDDAFYEVHSHKYAF